MVTESPTKSTCPRWCSFDHDGPVLAEDGDHEHVLARGDGPDASVDDVVDIFGADHLAVPEVRVWLFGDPAVDLPWDEETAGRLREWSTLLAQAADQLDQLAEHLPKKEVS